MIVGFKFYIQTFKRGFLLIYSNNESVTSNNLFYLQHYHQYAMYYVPKCINIQKTGFRFKNKLVRVNE